MLAFDTSGDPPSACLLRAGDARTLSGAPGTRAGDALHGLIERLLADAGLRPAELALIAAARGPGSFTGLRVGLATASGLSLATGVPAAGVETTRAVAQAAAAGAPAAAAESPLPVEIVVILEAGQGRLSFARHLVADGWASPFEGALDLEPDDVLARLRASGSRAVVRGRPPSEDALLAAGAARFEAPLAEAVARLAARLGAQDGSLVPLYARAPAIRPPSR